MLLGHRSILCCYSLWCQITRMRGASYIRIKIRSELVTPHCWPLAERVFVCIIASFMVNRTNDSAYLFLHPVIPYPLSACRGLCTCVEEAALLTDDDHHFLSNLSPVRLFCGRFFFCTDVCSRSFVTVTFRFYGLMDLSFEYKFVLGLFVFWLKRNVTPNNKDSLIAVNNRSLFAFILNLCFSTFLSVLCFK